MKTVGQILMLAFVLACGTNDLCWDKLDQLEDEQYVLNNSTKASYQNKIKLNKELLVKIKVLKKSYNCEEMFIAKYRYNCDKLIYKGEEYVSKLNDTNRLSGVED